MSDRKPGRPRKSASGGPAPRPAVRKPAGSERARQVAAVVLEVLGGTRSVAEAASVLGVSPPRYYALEAQALAGLVHGCEPRGKGHRHAPGAEQELQSLKQEQARLTREHARLQALYRGLLRTTGGRPPAPPARDAAGRKRRQPMVRALRHVATLRTPPAPEAPPVAPAPAP